MFSLSYVGEEDLEFITDIRQDPEVQEYLGTLLFTNKQKQKQWFEKTCADPTKMYFVFKESGLIDDKIGYVRFTDIDYINRSVCVGGDIHSKYRGKGYSKDMYKLIFDTVFNKMNMNKCYLWVLETNKRAIHIYNKLGFKENGRSREAIFKHGQYQDYIYMDILKKECTF